MLKDNGYIGKQGLSCLSSCFVNYLNYRGCNITEADVLLSDKVKVFYYRDNNCPILSVNVYEVIKEYYSSLGIKCMADNSDRNARQLLRKMIEEDTLLTLEVGYGSLNYNPIFQHSQSAEHFINVVGINDNNVYIDDSFIPVYPPKSYSGWYELDMLEKAWAETDYSYRIWSIPDSISSYHTDVYKLLNALKRFLSEYMAGGIEENTFYGIDAMKMIKQDIYDFGIRKSEEVSKLLFDYNYMIKTKGAFTIKLVIHEALSIINKEFPCADLLAEAEAIVKEWNQLSMLMIKVSIVYKSNKDLVRIINKIDSIIEHEMQVYKRIIKFTA